MLRTRPAFLKNGLVLPKDRPAKPGQPAWETLDGTQAIISSFGHVIGPVLSMNPIKVFKDPEI